MAPQHGQVAGKKKHKKGKDLDALKRELELDEHRVSIDELYHRYGSCPKKVQYICTHIIQIVKLISPKTIESIIYDSLFVIFQLIQHLVVFRD